MKKTLSIFVVLIVAVGVLYFGIRNTDNRQGLEGEQERSAVISEGGPKFDPVSLPALMQKEFDGRDLTLGRVLDENSSYTRYYMTYKSGDLTISGIMNVPKGEGRFPLLILNHGFIDPVIYTNGRGLKREQDYLARRGYVVIHPDYRNHADSDTDPENDTKFRLGYTEDVINAVLAAKNSDLDFINGNRVGMLGHSMGGGITQNILVVKPELIDAAVLFAPVSADQRDNYNRWTTRSPETAQRILQRFGHYDDNPEFWDNLSAETFFERVETPVMIHHGTADESVPLSWSEDLYETLEEAGKDSTLFVYEDEPHEFIKAWLLVMQRTVDFFDKNLK